MSYTSKYTAEQIEDKLTQVFDSTLQTKEIELTSNGTTELTADAGFLGLKSVSVNVNVPQEGGGGDGDSLIYCRFILDDASLEIMTPVEFLSFMTTSLGFLIAVVKIRSDYGVAFANPNIATSSGFNDLLTRELEIAMAKGSYFSAAGDEKTIGSMEDLRTETNLPEEMLIELTKEEFYNTES